MVSDSGIEVSILRMNEDLKVINEVLESLIEKNRDKMLDIEVTKVATWGGCSTFEISFKHKATCLG